MIKHQGEIIREAVRQKGLTVTAAAKKIGMTRANLYDVFKREFIDGYLLLRIGKALDYDFTEQIPNAYDNVLNEPREIYESNALRVKRLEHEVEVFKEKCYSLMEENKLLMKDKLHEYFIRYGKL